MPTSQSTIDLLLDVLSTSRQVSARKMFGEYCLYYAGRPVGLVCDEQLFLKPTEAGRLLMQNVAQGTPYPGARSHLLIGADYWDDRAWMQRMVQATHDALPPPKPPAPSKLRTVKAKSSGKPAALHELANLGPKSLAMLQQAGIHTVAQLRKAGAVVAYVRVKQCWPQSSLNLLWALEGAISDLPWQTVAREHRTSLLLALEQFQNQNQSQNQSQSQSKPRPDKKAASRAKP